jgi:hypothetical protein
MVILRTREICEDPEQMNPGKPVPRAFTGQNNDFWLAKVATLH